MMFNLFAVVARLLIVRNAIELEIKLFKLMFGDLGVTGRKWDEMILDEGYHVSQFADKEGEIGTNSLVKFTYETQMEYILGWNVWNLDYMTNEEERQYNAYLDNYGIKSVSFASHRLARVRRQMGLVGHDEIKVINGTETQKTIDALVVTKAEVARDAIEANMLLCDMDQFGMIDSPHDWDHYEYRLEFGNASELHYDRGADYYDGGEGIAFRTPATHMGLEWEDLS